MNKASVIIILLFAILQSTNSATAQRKTSDAYVDKNGVLRWGGSNEEVYGFGVNYTAPFAHGYRAAKKLGVDLEKEIEKDVYHFSRLGFEAFRIHVWDTEISDSTGNLINNEHLRLFDFLLMRLKERKIKIFLTPIAFWGNGYPERDEKTPGFATKYGKDACLTNTEAIKAQENYLYQFLNHVNPYTKTAYKNDPDILGFEVSNEPHHRGTPAEVKTYINRLVKAMRRTGCKKPILYNISHSIHLSKTYFEADIDGGTFQWYPTGLGAGHELRGNFLPNVDLYSIPFANESGFKGGAKVVYEFDAADVGRSYIYPAIARSFRTAGIQWATHFAYDPTYMAYANTEYNTHYMNLVYAPQKALSLKIASEVFHVVPRYKDFGKYPSDTTFNNFRVSYREDLAEYATEEKFFYTNTTRTSPPSPEKLEEIAGYGSSTVVSYEGRGAYFLDKVSDGVWRLEVLPDALWVGNIFGRNSLDRRIAEINWRMWPMQISLPDLGNNFSVKKIAGNGASSSKGNGALDVTPGVYLLTRKGLTETVKADDRWKNIRLNEFTAPATTLSRDHVIHSPYKEVTSAKGVTVSAEVFSPDPSATVRLEVVSGRRWRTIPMKRTIGYHHSAEIPAEFVTEGYLKYFIVIDSKNSAMTFPGGISGDPSQWDFSGRPYETRVVDASKAITLFDVARSAGEVSKEWREGSTILPGTTVHSSVLRIHIKELAVRDEENLNGSAVADYSLRYNFNPDVAGRRAELKTFRYLSVKAGAGERPFPVQIAFVDKDGNAFGTVVTLTSGLTEQKVELDSFKPVKMVTLPRPYPTFLPYYFESAAQAPAFDISSSETIQISIGPGLPPAEMKDLEFLIESVSLLR
jgi:hypothetical protein